MNKRNTRSILILALCIVSAAAGVSAQSRYANVYSRADVDNFVRSLEASSDVFSRDFKSAGGTTSTERKNVDRFENAIDRLRSRFNNTNNWWQSRNAVQDMMTEARSVNVMMRNEAYQRRLERQWRDLRRDINKLADTYELQELEGGNGGGYPGGGGGARRPPDWAVGTWYWVEGRDRSFTIEKGGNVRENTGSFGQGIWDRGGIVLNGNLSTVTRTSNGIRTYNTATGETSNYTRGGAEYPGGGGGGGARRPPDWAVGTWYWVEGRNRSFTIDKGGRVEELTGNMGQGYWDRGGIVLNGDLSTVTRTSNGIRTYNSTTGETSNYTRNGAYPGPGNGDGDTTRPPDWARGTWVWVQGSGRQFTIENTGRVVENINGRVSYGTYSNGVVTLNGSSSTITQTRNGIRTYNQSTGETSDYVRR
ncbi:MAG TPA: hypothetical protein VJV05_18435 [Pyrinomonadaceae bacterium]|nr:hypothetical protein [Pyrinomonadaceae bacterium]